MTPDGKPHVTLNGVNIPDALRDLQLLADEWHKRAATVNQANSPSIYIECSGELNTAVEELAQRLNLELETP